MYSGDPCLHRQRCSRILLLLLVAALPKLCLFFFSRWREFSLCSTPRRLCLYQGKMSNFWGNVVFIFRASLLLVLSFSEEAVSHVKANECKLATPPNGAIGTVCLPSISHNIQAVASIGKHPAGRFFVSWARRAEAWLWVRTELLAFIWLFCSTD